jgi:site-specific recombinase XerD
MFEKIFFPRNAEIYRAAPLVDQRERYLVHLSATGAKGTTLRKCANDQMSLMRLLNLKEGDKVGLAQIEAVTAMWSQPRARRCDRSASTKAKLRFVKRAVRWLHFLGWFEEAEREHHPNQEKVSIFEKWLLQERGLSKATVEDYCRAADHFFFWLAGTGIPLDAVQIADIDDAFAEEHKRGAKSRRTIHDYAQRLRAFFLYAETQSWCRTGLAAGIMPPRFMADQIVPKGIKRDDVVRLLASVQGDRLVEKRDRAILMLFVTYGLRAGEVAGLRLDDLDWQNEIIRVHCPKPGRTHVWPLSPDVGNAILYYIREARPTGLGRSLFFTSYAPIRPVSRQTLGKIVHDRLAGIGIVSGRRGTHALRHAAAQHLLDQGMSMKVIGDFLGHRDPSSTAIYAKVDLAALREVAALDLEGLA